MSRFAEKYNAEVAPALMKKFGYSSVMQIPKFNKIVINVGCGDAKDNSKVIDNVIEEITLIAGQKAVPTFARKSVANFKLREEAKETWVRSLGQEDLQEESMATHSSVLAWRIPGMGKPGGLRSTGSHRVGHD